MSVPRLPLPPAPDGHCQAGQRYRTYPIHPELVGHRPLGLRPILTGRVVEETHAEYGLISFSMSLERAGKTNRQEGRRQERHSHYCNRLQSSTVKPCCFSQVFHYSTVSLRDQVVRLL
jgi:hypothetical protein